MSRESHVGAFSSRDCRIQDPARTFVLREYEREAGNGTETIKWGGRP